MHFLVKDVDAWWARVSALDLASRYDVGPPAASALQPWGLVVAYVWDPAGVLGTSAKNGVIRYFWSACLPDGLPRS